MSEGPSLMILERVEGIEPSHPPWQGDRLPLHHTRMVRAENYDISTYWLKASCSSSELRPLNLVAAVGIEPTTTALSALCSTPELCG